MSTWFEETEEAESSSSLRDSARRGASRRGGGRSYTQRRRDQYGSEEQPTTRSWREPTGQVKSSGNPKHNESDYSPNLDNDTDNYRRPSARDNRRGGRGTRTTRQKWGQDESSSGSDHDGDHRPGRSRGAENDTGRRREARQSDEEEGEWKPAARRMKDDTEEREEEDDAERTGVRGGSVSKRTGRDANAGRPEGGRRKGGEIDEVEGKQQSINADRWEHDKYEEMIQEERRNHRGGYGRGRGRDRRGYGRGRGVRGRISDRGGNDKSWAKNSPDKDGSNFEFRGKLKQDRRTQKDVSEKPERIVRIRPGRGVYVPPNRRNGKAEKEEEEKDEKEKDEKEKGEEIGEEGKGEEKDEEEKDEEEKGEVEKDGEVKDEEEKDEDEDEDEDVKDEDNDGDEDGDEEEKGEEVEDAILDIQIEVKNGQTLHIRAREDDDPRQLAVKFCMDTGFSSDYVEKLTELISENILHAINDSQKEINDEY